MFLIGQLVSLLVSITARSTPSRSPKSVPCPPRISDSWGPRPFVIASLLISISVAVSPVHAENYYIPNLEHLTEHPIECMNGTVFSTFVDVFGIYLVATPDAPDSYVKHSANVLAEYLDNDEDGAPDDPAVTNFLAEGNYIVPIWASNDRDAFFEGTRGTYCEDNVGTAASLYYLEDQWAIGGIEVADSWDTNLEEIWHVISKGWYAVYPESFGDAYEEGGNESTLMEAMDLARGGKFLTPPEQYPPSSWYNYYDESCSYACQLHEYFYWGVVANIGALEKVPSKCGPSSDSQEWTLCTREQLREIDPMMFALLNEDGFNFPTTIPDGNYRGLNPYNPNEPGAVTPDDSEEQEGTPVPSSSSSMTMFSALLQAVQTARSEDGGQRNKPATETPAEIDAARQLAKEQGANAQARAEGASGEPASISAMPHYLLLTMTCFLGLLGLRQLRS